MIISLKEILDIRRLPWLYIVIALFAALATALPALRAVWLYDRDAIQHGEVWRIWTGHVVHFGWPHFLADGALFIIIGWVLKRDHPRFASVSLFVQPLCVCAALYWFEPEMKIYGGLSGLNVGLLVFLAVNGWEGRLLDWFWPAILLIHVGELYLEVSGKGVGGGAIRFDDPTIKVATVAHLGGVAFGLVSWLATKFGRRAKKSPSTRAS